MTRKSFRLAYRYHQDSMIMTEIFLRSQTHFGGTEHNVKISCRRTGYTQFYNNNSIKDWGVFTRVLSVLEHPPQISFLIRHKI